MLNSEEIKYKEFIKLQNRCNKLWNELRDLPLVKLENPYQRGWVISYDLRSDIKNRKDYPEIKEALDLGWHETYTNNVKVVRAIRNGDNSSLIKGKYNKARLISDYYPIRNKISEKEYLISKSLNKYYTLDSTSEAYTKYNRKYYYCSFPSYWLVLKVKPNIITHTRLKGGEIEREYDFLRYKLYGSGDYYNFLTNYSKSYPSYKDRTKVRSKIRKFINGDIDDIYNDKVPLEYTY